MAAIKWDETGAKKFETGIDHCVLYDVNTDTTTSADYYGVNGVAWNGITGMTESPSGAEDTDFYADNIKYGSMKSAEDFGGTITAYTYPDEWEKHDGSADLVPGVKLGQQDREPFGLSYRTKIGNDVKGADLGYRIHLIYGASAKPSQRAYKTVNNSPEANEFSWEIKTTPINVANHKATSIITIDSTTFITEAAKAALKAFEDELYGTDDVQDPKSPRLPSPAKVKSLLTYN